MNFGALLLVGLSLSMDAFAISILNGIAYNGAKRQVFLTAFAFGFAQALMPVIGYLLGVSVNHIIEAYDHWIAFGLLALIGGKMALDAIRDLRSGVVPQPKPLTAMTLILQAIATSVDALAVGISFAALKVNIITASATIGITTLLFCLFGGIMGQRIGSHFQKYATLLGGCILIIIGVKILLEHIGVL